MNSSGQKDVHYKPSVRHKNGMYVREFTVNEKLTIQTHRIPITEEGKMLYIKEVEKIFRNYGVN